MSHMYFSTITLLLPFIIPHVTYGQCRWHTDWDPLPDLPLLLLYTVPWALHLKALLHYLHADGLLSSPVPI